MPGVDEDDQDGRETLYSASTYGDGGSWLLDLITARGWAAAGSQAKEGGIPIYLIIIT